MSVSITLSSGDVGGIITAIGTVVIGLLQVSQKRLSKDNARKIDENTAVTRDTATKVNDNTTITKDTAAKVEEVHKATAAIAESTGTHPTLPGP